MKSDKNSTKSDKNYRQTSRSTRSRVSSIKNKVGNTGTIGSKLVLIPLWRNNEGADSYERARVVDESYQKTGVNKSTRSY